MPLFVSAGVIWTDVLLMEEVLPEAGLADFSLEVSFNIFIDYDSLHALICAGVNWIDYMSVKFHAEDFEC